MDTKNQSLMDAVLASNIPHDMQLDLLRLIRSYESVVMQGKLLSVCTNLMITQYGPQRFAEQAWNEETERLVNDSAQVPIIKHDQEEHVITLERK